MNSPSRDMILTFNDTYRLELAVAIKLNAKNSVEMRRKADFLDGDRCDW